MSTKNPTALFPVRRSMLVFGQPDIQQAEIDEVVATLESRSIGTGPRTARFERAFADYVGSPEAVAVNSCTSGLMLALRAAGIGPGDEVITTPLTFCATVNAILHVGATPVLADVEPGTLNIDPMQILRRITPRTRALLPVHFAGRPCAMGEIVSIARQRDLLVIEDCAHAIETEFNGQHAGTFGDLGCFSFNATNSVSTADGGMVVARDPKHVARIKALALHGMTSDVCNRTGEDGYRHCQIVDLGFKCNMTDLHAALGIRQLARVDASWARRREIWQRYMRAFEDLPLVLPSVASPGTRHAYHLFTVLVEEGAAGISRNGFVKAMTAQNIGVGVHYLSLPEHPFYRQQLGWRPEQWPRAARIGRQTVSLPLSPAMTRDDVEDTIVAVRRALGAEA